MGIKEADRLGVMRQIDKNRISLKKASEELGVSLRQTKRIRRRYLELGDKGVLSRHRGKKSPNRIPEEIKNSALFLLTYNYPDFGPTFACEKLQELHELTVSNETVRKWMIEAGLWEPKRKKQRRIHPRRTRRPRFGELIQADGSHHDWFEGRGARCCLTLFVDDATSAITSGHFSPTETTETYSICLKEHLKRYGRPLSMYVDKHSTFRVNKDEIKRGTGITHFGRVLKSLDIGLICAHSPQAKGRVERKNGVLQDRLVKDMRLANICSIEEANLFLQKWIESHNEMFGKKAACSENAHRKLRHQDKSDRVFSRKDQRKLSKDLTFQHQGVLYQIKTSTPNRLRYAYVDVFWKVGQPIEVECNSKPLDYTIWSETVYEQPKVVDIKELEAMWPVKTPVCSKRRHPWR